MQPDFQLAWHDGDDYPEWGSRPRRPLVRFDGAHQGEWMDSVIGPNVETGTPMVYHIVRCEYCIACHVWPLPEPAALARYYAEQFFQVDKPDYVARYEADRRWWTACVYTPIFQQCKEWLRLDCPKEDQTRCLDIGAGPGIALDVARRRFGWETWGIEPNGSRCEALRARDHQMVCGTLETIEPEDLRAFSGELFHVVMLYETLEHQVCPEETLLRVWDLLEPDGMVVVVVPSDWNTLQLEACKKLGLPHWWISPPQHLWYFSPATLKLLLRRTGFQILDCRSTFPLEKFLLEGRCYVGNDAIGRTCHTDRMAYELEAVRTGRWSQLEQTYRMNMTQRIGRELVFLGRKIG